ncbi:hypothetical protein PGTUg99_021157 [Puccinia graminis f. sp. tritici]|uniref:Uncharacterized protein n=1 Tax=Puccinia graminis f. sp. tritici TaxID=56615 RepID=A0A5B0MPR3_PUCGR|nr:hypothetical protein PGTUg99_021157 [Puccinia graminis f. sp. tritici]
MSYHSSATDWSNYDTSMAHPSMSPLDPAMPVSPHRQVAPQSYHYQSPLAPRPTQLPPTPAAVPPGSHPWPPNADALYWPTHVSSPMPMKGATHHNSLPPLGQPLPFNHQDPVGASPVNQDQEVEEVCSQSPVPLLRPTPGMFECEIIFLMYCARKNKHKKTSWVATRRQVQREDVNMVQLPHY